MDIHFLLRYGKYLELVSPIVAYWIASAYYELFSLWNTPYIRSKKLQKGDERLKNQVSRSTVATQVAVYQVVQVILGIVALSDVDAHRELTQTLYGQAARFLLAAQILDAWQYSLHRMFHEVPFLYRHIHSWHHRLQVNYSFGALYNHPLESILFDIVGGILSKELAGLSNAGAILFFAFANYKTVSDHCNYMFPINLLYPFFENGSHYHNVHHEVKGIKSNYQQPFFSFWDRLLGTYQDPDEFYATQAKNGSAIRMVEHSQLSFVSDETSKLKST